MNEAVLSVFFVFVSILVEAELQKVLARGVTAKDKKEIVAAHNDLRLLLMRGKVPNQPRATDMKELCWDDTLAKEAQKLADAMQFKHQRIADDRWNYIGQNLAKKASTKNRMDPEWRWAINSWFNEVKFYTYGVVPIRGTEHYTQVAWAKTTHVGCGYTYYMDPSQLFKYKKLYICNYGPGGNISGMKPYKTGRCGCRGLCKTKCKPCSKKKLIKNVQ